MNNLGSNIGNDKQCKLIPMKLLDLASSSWRIVLLVEQKFGDRKSREFLQLINAWSPESANNSWRWQYICTTGVKRMEDWAYIDEQQLQNCRCHRICITCTHFRYGISRSWRPVVACTIRRKQLTHGDHLLKVCKLWQSTCESPEEWG